LLSYFMCCIALVRCVLVLRCGLAVVVWYPLAGFSLHTDTNIQDTPQCCGFRTFPVVVSICLNSVFEFCVVHTVDILTLNISTNKYNS